jgi:hypothetical protein
MAHRHLVAAQQLRRFRAFSSEVDTGSRQENASNKKSRAPLRFHRSGKGSRSEADINFGAPGYELAGRR